jgi:hypothetical protein
MREKRGILEGIADELEIIGGFLKEVIFSVEAFLVVSIIALIFVIITFYFPKDFFGSLRDTLLIIYLFYLVLSLRGYIWRDKK